MSAKLHERFQEIIEKADLAGKEAVEKASVVPMVVGTPKNVMASLTGGDDGGFDPDEPVYYVSDGVCGFAWVNFKADATDGRKFLNWLKGSVKTKFPVEAGFGIGYAAGGSENGSYGRDHDAWRTTVVMKPRPDSYYGGVSMWIGGFNQSMQKKEAYGRAFAAVVNDAGIDGLRVHCMSRMD